MSQALRGYPSRYRQDPRLWLCLDVAGAPAQTERLVSPGDTVLILGAGGKSGLICTAAAKQKVGPTGRVIAAAHGRASRARAESLGAADVVPCDAKDAIATQEAVLAANSGKKVDITINCVSVPGTEMASILCTRDRGKVYFFSMATSLLLPPWAPRAWGRRGPDYRERLCRESL